MPCLARRKGRSLLAQNINSGALTCHGHVGGVHFLLHVLVVDPLAVVLHMSANVIAHQPCGRPDGDGCVESTAPSEAMAEAVWLQAFDFFFQHFIPERMAIEVLPKGCPAVFDVFGVADAGRELLA